MTETTPRYETVTVELDELRANINHYFEVKKTKRLVITKGGETYSVVGRWLEDESRYFFPNWPEVLYEMYPEPWDDEDPEMTRRMIDEERGRRPIST
jgi:hypothetical protein